jgi:hypothetical protein
MRLDFIGSVVEAAAAYDHDVLLSPSGVDSDRSFQRLLGERRVDGAILMEIRLEHDRVDHLAALDFPSVPIGRTAHPEHGWWVGKDHAALRPCWRNESPVMTAAPSGPAFSVHDTSTSRLTHYLADGC